MKKLICTTVKQLNNLDINNPEHVATFITILQALPLTGLTDQHPDNARLVLMRSLTESPESDAPAGNREDFEWNKAFFIRAMQPLTKSNEDELSL